MGEGIVPIEKRFFSERERVLLETGGLSASLFMYGTGVHGVRIRNSKGFITVLPYLGQQVWEAFFGGRELGMKSKFNEPRKVSFFIHTYGCFMMHCGALRMGCPGPGDDHPLHGELPVAEYDTARLVFGEDSKGEFVGVGGSYRYGAAFAEHYDARPLVKVYRDSSLFDISIVVENMSAYPMDLMYMCHVNFRPVDGGRIVQSVGWDPAHMVLRERIPAHVKVDAKFADFLSKLRVDPGVASVIRPKDIYKPEVVFFTQNPKTDREGRCHFLQVHPDGSADYIGYKPDLLDHAARWISRTADQEALGIALPATCDPEGYGAEKKKGNLKEIPGGSSVTFEVTTGYLAPPEAKDVEKRIDALMKGGS